MKDKKMSRAIRIILERIKNPIFKKEFSKLLYKYGLLEYEKQNKNLRL